MHVYATPFETQTAAFLEILEGVEDKNMFFFRRRFLPLFITQFFNAFSDSAFRNAIAILITYRIAKDSQEAGLLVTLSAGIFILPYFLFSATAGQLADKYDRARLTRIYKIMEAALMALAVLAFYHGNTWFLMIILFAMGAQSTFFGPIKYALLPQQLKSNELMTGNAYVEGGTFISILVGTIVGGLVILLDNGVLLISVILMASAVFGYIASRFIMHAPGGSPELKINGNIFQESFRVVSNVSQNRRLFSYLLLISWFWLMGSIFLSQMSIFTKEYLYSDETVVTMCLTIFSVGIAAGSIFCSKISRGKPSLRFVPAGAMGMAICTALLIAYGRSGIADQDALYNVAQFAGNPAHLPVALFLFGIAFFGGIYTVPLYTLVQIEANKTYIARVIATNNILNSFFMVTSAILVLGIYAAGFSVLYVFGLPASGNLIIALYLYCKRGKWRS